eukprot:CAMPEP_0171307666 /NCGR_PEP_ID=MMETSP0816-20121228/17691_1 /TAXON_ID=420281 /ORGANISM="Proboscia inermis, Strain CCAP1064/1" /LENGTH=67 /DNA_ID=CAMNT_0011789973 /DNA_START=78 /DNA_END=278 /DNA_ORIENTATION=+
MSPEGSFQPTFSGSSKIIRGRVWFGPGDWPNDSPKKRFCGKGRRCDDAVEVERMMNIRAHGFFHKDV